MSTVCKRHDWGGGFCAASLFFRYEQERRGDFNSCRSCVDQDAFLAVDQLGGRATVQTHRFRGPCAVLSREVLLDKGGEIREVHTIGAEQ